MAYEEISGNPAYELMKTCRLLLPLMDPWLNSDFSRFGYDPETREGEPEFNSHPPAHYDEKLEKLIHEISIEDLDAAYQELRPQDGAAIFYNRAGLAISNSYVLLYKVFEFAPEGSEQSKWLLGKYMQNMPFEIERGHFRQAKHLLGYVRSDYFDIVTDDDLYEALNQFDSQASYNFPDGPENTLENFEIVVQPLKKLRDFYIGKGDDATVKIYDRSCNIVDRRLGEFDLTRKGNLSNATVKSEIQNKLSL